MARSIFTMIIDKNIVVLGVGHSGTRHLTSILMSFGLNADVVDEHAENPKIVALNAQAIQTGALDIDCASALLASLGRPFVVKDPRFVKTLNMWKPLFKDCMLILLEKNSDEILKSHVRRNEDVSLETIEYLQQLARKQYNNFRGDKISITHEQIMEILKLTKRYKINLTVQQTSAVIHYRMPIETVSINISSIDRRSFSEATS